MKRPMVVAGLTALVVALIMVTRGAGPDSGTGADEATARAPVKPAASPDRADLPPLPVASHGRREGTTTAAVTGDPDARGQAVPAEPATITGRLVRPDAGLTGEGHSVWLLELGPTGSPLADGGRARAALEPDGRFRLDWPSWAEVSRVLLVGRGPELVPASEELNGRPEGPVELPLTAGATLTGRVTLNGKPVTNWPVDVDQRFGTPGVFGAGAEAFWLGGRFVEKHRSARTDADGRYRLTGLIEASYDLRCSRISPSVLDHWMERVPIDGQPRDIELGEVSLAVLATSAGVPLEGARIVVRCDGREEAFTSRRVPTKFTIPEARPVNVEITHASHSAATRVVAGAPVGTRVDLVVPLMPATRPQLQVHLPGADAAGVQQLPIDTRPRPSTRSPTKLRALGAPGLVDTFEVSAFPGDPGKYDLRLLPVGPFASEVVTIEVPSSGVVHAGLRGIIGGRFEIDFRADAEEWSAHWSIEDAVGATVVGPILRETFPEFRVDQKEVERASFLTPKSDVLPVGDYVLVTWGGDFKRQRSPFTIVAGETTPVRVQLEER